MKSNKKLKPKNDRFNDDVDLLKTKKKAVPEKKKVNLKSPKFWDEVWDDDEEDFSKLLR
jgi:hypothetical protein